MPKFANGSKNHTNHRVVALVYDHLCTFEFGIVAEIFGLHRPEMGENWYGFKSVALEGGPLGAAGGLRITATGNHNDLEKADTIIVPGWRGKDESVPPPMIKALQGAHGRGARIVSICSGIYVLAAAGLLKGRTATTHWRYLKDFEGKYPDVNLAPNSLYVQDANIVTSAGSSAGIDLCLHLVRQDFGVKRANCVARRLVTHAHREGGQAQFIEQPVPEQHDASRLSDIVEFVRTHLDKDHRVKDLAHKAGMSTRTFQRKFLALTGLPIGRWIRQERMSRARALLETGDARIDDVAAAVGMPSVGALRYYFRKKMGVSPGQYRKRFAGN